MSPRLEISRETDYQMHYKEEMPEESGESEEGRKEVGEKPVLCPSAMLVQVTGDNWRIAFSGEIFTYLDLRGIARDILGALS